MGPGRSCGGGVALLTAALGGLVGPGGCAAGSVRNAQVGPLGSYPGTRAVAVEVAAPDPAAKTSPLAGAVQGAARRALDDDHLPAPPTADVAHLTLRLAVIAAVEPAAPADTAGRALSAARSWFGLAGVGASGAAAGRLELAATLLAPDGASVGHAQWEHEGAPAALAADAGEQTARALAHLIDERRDELIARRAADERLLLTPTALTLSPGEFVVSDDELIMARVGVGLSRHLQLDLMAGGFPIPGAGSFLAPAHGLVAVGGAGVVVFGFFDLGLKLRVLDETAHVPGVAVAYDMLDVFGLAAGGVGVVFLADGAGGGGYGVVGGANAQFNLFTAVAAKHFGPFQLTAGAYVLDNHHYLPQSAGFQSGCAAAATNGSDATAGAIDCGSGSTTLPRLPLKVQPFVGSELVLGPHSALMLEGLLEKHIQNSLVTTGARWLLGWSRPRGPLALDRIRVRLDLAALWLYEPATDGPRAHGARVLPLPWLGLGVYVL